MMIALSIRWDRQLFSFNLDDLVIFVGPLVLEPCSYDVSLVYLVRPSAF